MTKTVPYLIFSSSQGRSFVISLYQEVFKLIKSLDSTKITDPLTLSCRTLTQNCDQSWQICLTIGLKNVSQSHGRCLVCALRTRMHVQLMQYCPSAFLIPLVNFVKLSLWNTWTKKKLLSDKLYSFCYSRSTVDIKIVITYRISKALDNKNISRVFTLDIFDKVYHKGLLHVCQLWNLWDSPLGHQVLPVKVIIKGQSSKAHEVSADIPSPKAHFLVLPSFSFVLMISLGTFWAP